MQFILNIQDQVTGAWHQITAEKKGQFWDTRIDGNLLPNDMETRRRILMLIGAFEDDFEGIVDYDWFLAAYHDPI